MAESNDTQASKLATREDCKQCATCGEVKSRTEFYLQKRKSGKYSPCSDCKKCHNASRAQRYGSTKWEDHFGVKHGTKLCVECGINMWGESRAKRCQSCKDKKAAELLKSRPSIVPRERRLPTLGVWFLCVECGERQLSSGSRSRKFCSKACRWRHMRRNRRARNRNAFVSDVNLFEIAERDKWLCQLCGKRVKKEASFKRQATLDHVIPISMGGMHEPFNCQLAHFDCNSKKHNKVSTLF